MNVEPIDMARPECTGAPGSAAEPGTAGKEEVRRTRRNAATASLKAKPSSQRRPKRCLNEDSEVEAKTSRESIQDLSPGHPEYGSAAELGTPAMENAANGYDAEVDQGAVRAVRVNDLNTDGQLQILPTQYLRIDADGDRFGVEHSGCDAAFDKLVANIKQLGVLEPIVVRCFGPCDYRVLAGRRRLRAALQLSLPKVPCHVLAAREDRCEDFLITLSENAQRKENTPYEQAVLFQEALKATGLEKATVAKEYGVAKSVVTDYLKLLDPQMEKILTPEEFQKLKTGEYSAKSAIRKLDEQRTLPGEGNPGNGGGDAQGDPAREYVDHESGITFKVGRQRGSAPPSWDRLIPALQRWIRVLETANRRLKAH